MKIKSLLSVVCVLASLKVMADGGRLALEPVSKVRVSLTQLKSDFDADRIKMQTDESGVDSQMAQLKGSSSQESDCRRELKSMRTQYSQLMIGMTTKLISVVSENNVEELRQKSNSVLELRSEIRSQLLKTFTQAEVSWSKTIDTNKAASKCPAIFANRAELDQGVKIFTVQLKRHFSVTDVDVAN